MRRSKFAVKFKQIRDLLDLNQSDFGALLGLKQSSVSTIETDRSSVSMEVLDKLKALVKKRKLKVVL